LIRNLTPEEYESEKIRIITLMFDPYSSNNADEYIAGQQVSKDKIKNRIDYQMYKNYIKKGADIESDVLQDLFENLLKINQKNTKRFVDDYYQNPNTAYYFAYSILVRKGFSVDKNYPTKPISTAKKILHTSSLNPFNRPLNYQTEEDATEEVTINDDG
jgi:hypothetical protein